MKLNGYVHSTAPELNYVDQLPSQIWIWIQILINQKREYLSALLLSYIWVLQTTHKANIIW